MADYIHRVDRAGVGSPSSHAVRITESELLAAARLSLCLRKSKAQPPAQPSLLLDLQIPTGHLGQDLSLAVKPRMYIRGSKTDDPHQRHRGRYPNEKPMPKMTTALHTKLLDASTWPDFARLVEKHGGVWGGCWCMSFHLEGGFGKRTALHNRAEKQQRVRDGDAHAALVYDGSVAIGWCQFGPTAELPRIKNKRAYRDGLAILPDWRITCFFVDRDYRGRGVASAALQGALREIARLGGGTVESYPHETDGRPVSASFLHNGTLSMFDREGFERSRRLGKNHWVVTKLVPSA